MRTLVVACITTALTGCSVTLVQPYDEKLFNDTEAVYKKAAAMIGEGESTSPVTDEQRRAISDPARHPAHFSRFASKYDALLIDADALLMRAMAGSSKLDATGERINTKIEKLINEELPSNCAELEQEFAAAASLTVKNYVDVKCLLVRWRAQHADPKLTEDKLILKRANWEGRRLNFFNAVLAIQKAEGFKKPQ